MLSLQGELRSLTPGAKMAAVQLTGVHVLLVITFGIMAFFLLFLFAKRQIMRFALRSHRGPHVLVGSASPGSMKEEIERRLDRIAGIKYEPRLLCAVEPGMLAEPTDGTVEGDYNYIYRMKAVDAAALLDAQLQELDPELRRPAGKSFRQHLTELREGPGAPLKSAKLSLCNSFADSYEHARHGQKPFGEAEYRKYVATLNELLTCIKNKIYRKKSHVTFQNVAQVYSNSTSSHKMSADSILLAEEEAVAGRGEEEIELDVLDADSSGASYETSV
ncbi:protein C1orf43 homolog [Branchiostoma floridae]|uniref:Protein C1orf43 homolog n=1 Tax=Branchiostoma floridae TaxID=7739 RepID=A0A9J7KP82_BRAFL|nr:protein C1orf43 homolog [Branchiostoma floridae]